MSHVDAVAKFLSAIPASAFVASSPVFKIESSTSLRDAVRVLNDNNVTGAPVFVDDITSMDDLVMPVAVHDVRYIGFVDVADLVSAVLTSGLTYSKPTSWLGRLSDFFLEDTKHLVDSAVNLSGRDKFVAITTKDTLLQATHMLVDNRVHRLAVVGQAADGARIQGIITQTDILQVVRDNLATLGHLARATVGSLFPTHDGLLTMPSSSSLRQCFHALSSRGLAGCALVDSAGVIVGNISVSDVRQLSDVVITGGDVDTVLDDGVTAFLAKGGDLPRAAVTVTLTDTLASLIELMLVSRVHRVHVVDGHRVPIGVVTMMDVIRLMLSSELTLHTGESVTGDAATPVVSSASDRKVDSDDSKPEAVSCPLVSSSFRAVTALDFVKKDGVVIEDLLEISADSSIAAAMSKMAEHRLSSLPVVREEVVSWTGMSAPFDYDYVALPVTEKKYAGWLDCSDVAAVVLARSVSSQKKAGIVSSILNAFTVDDEHATIASMNFSHNNPFWAVPTERRMDKVLRAFATQGVHRLAVISTAGHGKRLIGVITQSSIIRFVAKNIQMLEPVNDISMSQFLLKPADRAGTLATIPVTATARDALQTLVSHKVSGAPVVDSDGVIVANFSVSDVRLLAAVSNQVDADAALALPVLDFLRERAPKDMHSIAPSSLSPVVVQESDSVAMAIQLLAESRLHHIYIVDASRRPVGVLSLTDVIRALVWCLE